LTTWNGSYSYQGSNYTYNMVGTAPSTGTSTTIPVYIIPLKVVITKKAGGTTTFDPSTVQSNGKTATANTVASPIFQNLAFTSGGVSMGTTQYEDAFQRANFWGTVSGHTGYHVLLGTPTVLAEQTLSPPKTKGKTGSPFGTKVGLVDINWYDTQIQALIKKFTQIVPNSIPIFIVYDTYLTESGSCCIGGYHSAEGTTGAMQAYSNFSYVSVSGDFSQDVSALSHELGEWLDDPLVNNSGNNTPCGILEVGDPLEGDANYGDYPYSLGGFTYHLQDLATLPYFGAPPSTSVNDEFTFQGTNLAVCANGS
jgi:hypothetical protein